MNNQSMHSRRRIIACLSATMSGSCILPAAAWAQAPSSLMFNAVKFLKRWSRNGQHEFTPEAEPDLQHWTNMLTINVHRTAGTGEKLAVVANQIAGNYRQHGKILRTASRPATAAQPAEHLIVAVFGRPAFLEAAFTRILLVNGSGYAITYSRRIHGTAAGPAMSEWLAANGGQIENTLLHWSDPALLAALTAI